MFKKSFNKSDRFGGDRKFGGAPSRFGQGGGGSFNRGPRTGGFDRPEMHTATCASCGNSCQVPFRPNGSKPVYCSDCFKRPEGDAPYRSAAPKKFGDFRSERPAFGEKRMFQASCDKCSKSCEVPFKPNGSKPVYCNDCFGGGMGVERAPRAERPMVSDNSEQLKSINQKLDTILAMLKDVEATDASTDEEAVA